MDSRRVILLLAAKPSNAFALRTNNEIGQIRDTIERSPQRDSFEIQERIAVTPDRLQDHIFSSIPHIVHYCGHGTADGIVAESDLGEASIISIEAFANLFKAWTMRNSALEKINCVVLNSCYSTRVARAISPYANYVVGLPDEVDDNTAIAFAKGFYLAIGRGLAIENCFQCACAEIAIRPQITPVTQGPVLFSNGIETSCSANISNFRKEDPRARFLWQLAYAFARLDQLPSGGWGKTLNAWMEAIWEGDHHNEIPRNPSMRHAGGTDITAYTFYHYYRFLKRQLSPNEISVLLSRNHVADRVFDNLSGKIGASGAVGSSNLPRGGAVADVRLRHTLIGLITFLLYSDANQHAQRIGDPIDKLSTYIKDYMHLWEKDTSHLYGMVCAAIKLNEILSADAAKQQYQEAELAELRALLNKHIPRMVDVLNTHVRYTPKPHGTRHGPVDNTYFVPYFEFWRMERSNFLMHLPFLISESGEEFLPGVDERLQRRCARILSDMLEDVTAKYDAARPEECLLRFHTGNDGTLTGSEPAPLDWGLSAEMSAVLQLPAVKKLLFRTNVVDPELFDRKVEALDRGLLDTFDQYPSFQQLFRFTTGTSFARVLGAFSSDIGDSRLLTDLDSHLTDMCQRGVTEEDLSILLSRMSKYVGIEEDAIDHRAVRAMLTTKLESGEYTPDSVGLCDPTAWQRRVTTAVEGPTISFYNSNKANQHIGRYSGDPRRGFVLDASAALELSNDAEPRLALDVGCGAGQYAKLLSENGFEVKLLDSSRKMLATACQTLGIPVNTFTPTSIYSTDWGYPDGCFDLIFACALMVHVPRDRAHTVLGTMHRLLKPNGILFVNYKIRDHSLIAEDGRFFEYYRDDSLPKAQLDPFFDVIEESFTKNFRTMYNERRQLEWANFVCRKRPAMHSLGPRR